MVKKTTIWILVVSIGVIALLYGFGMAMGTDSKEYKGAMMLKNEWKVFDLDKVPGETPASLFGGLQQGQAILKYRLELRYPFDGRVGFYGGSDREQVNEECFNAKNFNIDCEEKNETAYIFRTTDDGKTFTRQSLGHGIAQELKEIDGVYFLKVFEADRWASRTYRSDDQGKSWREIGKFYIDSLFDKDRFIYVVVKSLSMSKREYRYYYSNDGGKTAKELSKTLKEVYETSPHTVQNGKLVFFKENRLVYLDMEIHKEESHAINIPENKIVRTIHTDKRSNELYLELLNKDAKEINRYRTSIYYPHSHTHVEFTKSQKELDKKDIFLKVDGNYIGSLTRIKGVLFHFWTLDKGKKWEVEVLENYFYDDAFTGYGNNRIYMKALIVGEKGIKRGAYLIMGHIKVKK